VPGARGRLHRRERLDGSGELALQAALEGQALLELGHAEAVGLHQLEAGDRPLGQALRRQAQAGVVHLVGRHHDGHAALGVLVGHVHLRELGHDGAAVAVAQVGVQHPPFGLAAHEEKGQGQGEQRQCPHAQLELLRTVQAGKPLSQRAAAGGLEVHFGNGGAHGGEWVMYRCKKGGDPPVATDYSVPPPVT
jgi:hypothetical protein